MPERPAAHLRDIRSQLEQATADLRRLTAELDRRIAAGEIPDMIDVAIFEAIGKDASHRGAAARIAAGAFAAEHGLDR
jgi:hypothetical protein